MRFSTVALTTVLAISIGVSWTAGQTAPSKPTPPKITAKARPLQQIDADMAAVQTELREKLPFYRLLGKQYREQLAPTVTPLVQKLVALWDEKAALPSVDKGIATQAICEGLAILKTLGDKDAGTRLETMAKSTSKPDAARAKIGLALNTWWMNYGKEKEQLAAFDSIIEASKVVEAAGVSATQLIIETQNLTRDETLKVNQFVVDHFKTPNFASMRARSQTLLAQMALENKPMTIIGRTVDGKDFSSAQWKGKVIIVDFWATWCGPCIQEMPRMIQFYQENHAKGLEIIGISSDNAAGDLIQFSQQNPGVAWPHLFAASNGEWHPLTKKYSVNSIPTLFIIDKNGICRTVQGRSQMEKLVPQLLAEEVKKEVKK